MSNEKKCMKCDSPAVFKIIKMINGAGYEYYLCSEHAAAVSPTLKKNTEAKEATNIYNLIQQFLNQQQGATGSEPVEKESGAVCPNCHLNYTQYRKTLLLGCSECYDAFEDLLVKDLRKFHGAVSQEPEGTLGSAPTPKSASGLMAKGAPPTKITVPAEETGAPIGLPQLRQQLQNAIEHEDFERAAQLRDSIREMEEKQAKKTGETQA